MSERRRRWLPTASDPPPRPGDAGVPAALPGTGHCGDVAATVTGPSGAPLLRVALRTEPPDRSGAAGPLVVAAAGDVDRDTAPLLQAALVDAIDRHDTVCCDLSEVTFLGAAGLTALLVAHDRAGRAGSRLLIRGAHGVTRRVLQITRLDDVPSGQQQPAGDACSGMATPG